MNPCERYRETLAAYSSEGEEDRDQISADFASPHKRSFLDSLSAFVMLPTALHHINVGSAATFSPTMRPSPKHSPKLPPL